MRDATRTLPMNASISMTLRRCVSRSTVQSKPTGGDEVLYLHEDGCLQPASAAFSHGVCKQLDRLRELAGSKTAMRVATTNSFPTGAGIASSASGFAALTVAAASVLGLPEDVGGLSRLARLSGSGSAARSVLGGYVQWPGDEQDPESSANQLAPPEHWPLQDIVAVVDGMPKAISSLEGHRRALSSPYYAQRQRGLPERTSRVHRALMARDFAMLAEAVEEEAIDLHLIAMSAKPPIFYWQPGTLAVLNAVRQLRADGHEVCATIDAGPNVHVLCTPAHVKQAAAVLALLPEVQRLIVDEIGPGPSLVDDHLFP